MAGNVAWGGRFEIKRRGLASLTLPGGSVYRFTAERVAPSVAARAAEQLKAHGKPGVRSGRLRRSIRVGTPQVNQHRTDVRISCGGTLAPYANYVVFGSTGAAGRPLMTMYAAGPWSVYSTRRGEANAAGYPGYYLHRIKRVAGQSPNPFMSVGLHLGLKQHRVL